MRRTLLVICLCGLVASPSLSREIKRKQVRGWATEPPGEGPALGVIATLEPCMSVSVFTEPVEVKKVPAVRSARRVPLASLPGDLTEDRIRFYATGGPGMYNADREVVLLVDSNSDGWAISCRAASLVGDNGELPADRVYVKYVDTNSDTPPDGDDGFVDLGEARVVLSGAQVDGEQARLRFRLETTSDDKAGTYAGTIQFSYFIAP
jgi:hypothetical protein